jgi:hypothetical protein
LAEDGLDVAPATARRAHVVVVPGTRGEKPGGGRLARQVAGDDDAPSPALALDRDPDAPLAVPRELRDDV